MEGIPLWHERDISHSSVERICLPDAAAVTEHILLSSTMTNTLNPDWHTIRHQERLSPLFERLELLTEG